MVGRSMLGGGSEWGLGGVQNCSAGFAAENPPCTPWVNHRSQPEPSDGAELYVVW